MFMETKGMEESSFHEKVKQEIEIKTFDKLQQMKCSQSKVETVDHNSHKLQKYLKPNKKKQARGIEQESRTLMQICG